MIKFSDGIHNISNAEYHAAEGVSRSSLMLFNKSPYHYWYKVISGLATKEEPTKSMSLGDAFHALLLEPERFKTDYLVYPELEKLPEKVLLKDVGKEQFNAYKKLVAEIKNRNDALLDEFSILSEGKTVIPQSIFLEANKMVSLFYTHTDVSNYLEGCVFEQSIFWTDEETGLQFKARPDAWGGQLIMDIKTARDLSTRRIEYSAIEYGYFLQSGMIHEGCKAIGMPIKAFGTIAVENKEPYVPRFLPMSDESLSIGINTFHRHKKTLKRCLETNRWPAYELEELNCPRWYTINEEEE